MEHLSRSAPINQPGQDRVTGSPDQQDGYIDVPRICPGVVFSIREAPPDPAERSNPGGVAGRNDGSHPDGSNLRCPSAEVEAGEHPHRNWCDPFRSEQSTRHERRRPSGSEPSGIDEHEGPNEIGSSSGSAQGGEPADGVPDEGERSLAELLEDRGKEFCESTRAWIGDRVAGSVPRPVDGVHSCMAAEFISDSVEVAVVTAVGMQQHDRLARAGRVDCDPIDVSGGRRHDSRVHDRLVMYSAHCQGSSD